MSFELFMSFEINIFTIKKWHVVYAIPLADADAGRGHDSRFSRGLRQDAAWLGDCRHGRCEKAWGVEPATGSLPTH